jgi:hypothetical protein
MCFFLPSPPDIRCKKFTSSACRLGGAPSHEHSQPFHSLYRVRAQATEPVSFWHRRSVLQCRDYSKNCVEGCRGFSSRLPRPDELELGWFWTVVLRMWRRVSDNPLHKACKGTRLKCERARVALRKAAINDECINQGWGRRDNNGREGPVPSRSVSAIAFRNHAGLQRVSRVHRGAAGSTEDGGCNPNTFGRSVMRHDWSSYHNPLHVTDAWRNCFALFRPHCVIIS